MSRQRKTSSALRFTLLRTEATKASSSSLFSARQVRRDRFFGENLGALSVHWSRCSVITVVNFHLHFFTFTDVMAEKLDNSTALHDAVKGGHLEVAKLLLEYMEKFKQRNAILKLADDTRRQVFALCCCLDCSNWELCSWR